MSVTGIVGPAVLPGAPAPEPLPAGPAPSAPVQSDVPMVEPATADSLPPGTRVQVRRKFDDKWATGFEVAEATAHGYQVRRISDGELIPVPIPAADLRKEKKRSTWWY